jgi:N-methylhydantoinase A
VVGGGAGGTHALAIANELNLNRIIIPRISEVFCALGMLNADYRFTNKGSYYTHSNDFDFDSVAEVMKRLEQEGLAALAEAGVPEDRRKLEHSVSCSYPGQVYLLDVVLPRGTPTADTLKYLVEDFHNLHQKRYNVSERENIVEFLDWRVEAVGIMDKVSFEKQTKSAEDGKAALKGTRNVFFEEKGGYIETSVYDAEKLLYGMSIDGPAIIEGYGSTPLILPGAKVQITERGDYYIEL